jgi:adenylate cyclase
MSEHLRWTGTSSGTVVTPSVADPLPQFLSIRRRHVAILAADVVGYTRLMEAHEDDTHTWLMRLRSQVLDPGVATHLGHVVKNTGDGFIAIFDAARDAVQCAIASQRGVMAATVEQSVEQRVSFRMAVTTADVIVEDHDIFGDGVNVAARLQEYAEPGGIIVSGACLDELGSGHGLALVDLGDVHLRNITRPVRVFELRTPQVPSRLIGDGLASTEARASIAVLPFRMRPTSPEESYFASGVVDNIIHGLAALKELFVVARGSVLGYGGATIDVRAISKDLGVRYVLYGSVRRSGGRLRIETELSDAETGTIVRSDQYDGDLDDLFELQGRIAINVVRTIAPHVRERELVRARRKHPQNVTAYDFILQALDHLFRMEYESFSVARGLLQQALANDPHYALAHAYTAWWYGLRVGEMNSLDPVGDAAAGIAHADRALQLDGHDAQVLALCGHAYAFHNRDYRRAIDLYDRAIVAGPSVAMAWTMSSATRGYIGDAATAVLHAEQGLRLSPLDERLYWHEGLLAQAHYLSGNYDEALEWVSSAVERNESIRFNLRTRIATLVALGQVDQAREVGRQLIRVQPDFRLRPYAERCPFVRPILDVWLGRLQAAGLPE